MSLIVTENWSKRRFSPGKSGYREFMVSGASGEMVALSAPGVAHESEPYPADNRLHCDAPSVECLSSGSEGVYLIGCTFSPLAGGSNPEGEPIDKPFWYDPPDFVEEPEPFDRDADQMPVLNSSGSPFDAGFSRPTRALVIRAYRNESTYEPGKALAFIDHTNEQAFTLPGFGTFAPGKLLLLNYASTVPLSPGMDFVPVVYVFKARDDGFKARIHDIGYTGWYVNSSGVTVPGKITDGDGNYVNMPISLDGDGRPLNSTYKVNRQTPARAPASVPRAQIEKTAHGVFLIFRRYYTADFDGLTA